jgi:hypothetical protein
MLISSATITIRKLSNKKRKLTTVCEGCRRDTEPARWKRKLPPPIRIPALRKRRLSGPKRRPKARYEDCRLGNEDCRLDRGNQARRRGTARTETESAGRGTETNNGKREWSNRKRNLLVGKRKQPAGDQDRELETEPVSSRKRPLPPETGMIRWIRTRSVGYGDCRPSIEDRFRETRTAGWGMRCVQWTRALTGGSQPRAAGHAGFCAGCGSAPLYKETVSAESQECRWHARCISLNHPASPLNRGVISWESDGPRGQT